MLGGAALVPAAGLAAENSAAGLAASGGGSDAVATPANWPASASPAAISDPATEARIDAYLAHMTLEQKVGQLIQADISTITPADLATYPLGSILAGGNSGPGGDERAGPAVWDRLVWEFRAASSRPAANGIAIPVIFGIDAVHGHNNLPGATIFPHNIGLGAANDAGLIQRIGAATAAEVAGSGIEWTFAPTLAVPQDYRWGRTYEGYAADPALTARYARAMVLGLQGELAAGQPVGPTRVAATAKHFLADGGTSGGRDQGDALIDEAELIARHAQAYPPAIAAGALTVMASFSSWNGVKMHGNGSLLTGVLKDRMGFGGFVVGDWNGHGQVAGCNVVDCPAAINAGLDMFMAPDSWRGLYASTLAHARSGTIPMRRIDDAVRRILRVKFKVGLFDAALPPRRDYAAIGAPEHLALAREAVAKSLVLLKNNGSVLPIKPGARVLVAGPGANNLAKQSGGWTISWQGTDVTQADFPNSQTVWQALAAATKAAGGTAELAPEGAFTTRPDVAIVVFGETPYAEYQGDISTLAYQPGGGADLALIKKLRAAGVPVVALFLSGRPMFASAHLNAADAFVAAWLPGTQGAGIADVLVAGADGRPARDFTGRLPYPWPGDARSPITAPLFAAGYGLSYAAPAEVGVVSEDPGIDLRAAMNASNFFAGGRAMAPWALSISDAGGSRPVPAGSGVSPGGLVTTRSVDVRAQEDARAIVWSGDGAVAIDGPTADLGEWLATDSAMQVEWRLDARGTAPVKLGLADLTFDISRAIDDDPAAQPGQVMAVTIPLRCFAARGADLGRVGNGLRLTAGAGFAISLLRANIVAGNATTSCP